jgi:hypothetical protein
MQKPGSISTVQQISVGLIAPQQPGSVVLSFLTFPTSRVDPASTAQTLRNQHSRAAILVLTFNPKAASYNSGSSIMAQIRDDPSLPHMQPMTIEEQCARIMWPNSMSFTDNAGERHNIFLDLYDHDRACQLTKDKNWEELKKYPKYGMCFPATLFLHSTVSCSNEK